MLQREQLTRLLASLIAAHTLLLVVQSYANAQTDLAWTVGGHAFALMPFGGLPLLAILLHQQRISRIPAILLLGSFGASCVFQVQFNILDHQVFLPPAEQTSWRIVFQSVSVLLTLADGVGAVAVARWMQRDAQREPGA